MSPLAPRVPRPDVVDLIETHLYEACEELLVSQGLEDPEALLGQTWQVGQRPIQRQPLGFV